MNKSGKQKAAQRLSFNETHLQRTPIDADSTYRIGLCGFRINGSRQLVPSLKEAVSAAFSGADRAKLLLLPGRWKCGRWECRNSWPTIDQIAEVAIAAKLPIFFETIEAAPKPFYTAVSHTGKQLPLRLYQQFWNCKNATPELVEGLISECNWKGKRAVHIGGVTLGLLICGENNVLANKQSDDNRAYVRYSPDSPGATLFERFRIVFNGSHSKMGEWGKLERRFESLSANKRWFFYATNNKGKRWGSSTLRAYFNGGKIATSAGPPESSSAATTEVNGGISWNVTLKGKECQIPAVLVTSKDDRCRILTLDIPGKLLQ